MRYLDTSVGTVWIIRMTGGNGIDIKKIPGTQEGSDLVINHSLIPLG
jgi:hypothetical protein